VNTIEERLRDAFRADGEAIRPETIRPAPAARGGQPGPQLTAAAPLGAPGAAGHRASRILLPAAAAAAVTLIIVLTAVLVPRATPSGHGGGSQPSAAAPGYPRYFVALNPDNNGRRLDVRSAVSGALVGSVRPPHGSTFSSVATGNGTSFIAATWGPGACQTGFYRFRLRRGGRPTALSLSAGPVRSLDLDLAVSRDGQTIAYLGDDCASGKVPASSFLTVLSTATGQQKRWTYPRQQDVESLSLTADGGKLSYNVAETKLFPAITGLLATGARTGRLAAHSHIVARGAQFAPGTDIPANVLTPDGRTLYFSTNPTGAGLSWQLRAYNVATGQLRILHRFPGSSFTVQVDPAGRYLLLDSELGSTLSTPRLARLDTVTGKLSYLPAAWIGPDADPGIAW
jgi:hypothetical protein